MKITIICISVILFLSEIGVLADKKPPSLEELTGKLNPVQALHRARKLWDHEKAKIEFDSIAGPYFVLSLSKDFNSGYLLYFVNKDRFIVSEVQIDAYGKKERDKIMILHKDLMKIDDQLLDSARVKERFQSERGTQLILMRLVYYISFWGGFLPHAPVVWWLVDENGECYSMSLNGDLISFKEIFEQRKSMKGVKVIRDEPSNTPRQGDTGNERSPR
jgi:hypothetical protein